MLNSPTRKSIKRDSIDPVVYARMLSALTKIMNEVPKLEPDREAWDIEGVWTGTGTIYFVDKSYQPLFTNFVDFPCKTIKLTNYGKPAARISFWKKHRFWLIKAANLREDEKKAYLGSYLNELDHKIARASTKLNEATGSNLIALTNQINEWKLEKEDWFKILHDVDQFELAISNYDREYYYTTMNLKYLISDDEEYQNMDVHLLNPQKDSLGGITQPRYNIIFVDQFEIQRDHPHQHKMVHKYLNLFPIRSRASKHTLYARPKAINTTLDEFKPEAEGLVAEPRIVAQKQRKATTKGKTKKGVSPSHAAEQLTWWDQVRLEMEKNPEPPELIKRLWEKDNIDMDSTEFT